MTDLEVFHWSLAKAIELYYPTFKPRWIPLPDPPLVVTIGDHPELLAELRKNALLMQTISEVAKDAFIGALGSIVPRLQALDAECGAAGGDFYTYAASRKRIIQEITQSIQQAQNVATRNSLHELELLKNKKQAWKNYRLVVLFKLGWTGVLGVGTAAAGLAGAVPTGGAALAISIIGTYRAVSECGKTLLECAQDAHSVQKQVEIDLKYLQGTYAPGQRTGVALEVTAITFNAVLKPLFTDLPNAKTLEEHNKLWLDKLTHLSVLANELSAKLNDLLEYGGKLQAQLAADPNSEKKRAALRGFEAYIKKLLEEGFIVPGMQRRVPISESYRYAQEGFKLQKQIAEEIENLKARRSKGVDWYNSVITAFTDVAFMALGSAVTPPELKAADVLGVVHDGLENLKEIYDIAADNSPEVKKVEENVMEELAAVPIDQRATTRPRSNAVTRY